jgi:hypothetical protein
VCTYHFEPSHQLWCVVASHHRCLPAIVGVALVEFQSRPLGDKVLKQAAPLAKHPLPNACPGGHCLALPLRAHSRADRVRWHSPSCRVAHLGFDAPSISPPPTAEGQHHARIASMRGRCSSSSLRRLRPRMDALLTWRS